MVILPYCPISGYSMRSWRQGARDIEGSLVVTLSGPHPEPVPEVAGQDLEEEPAPHEI